MHRILFAASLLELAALTSAAQPFTTDPRDLDFVQISDDVHVAFRPDPLRYWVEGNVTIILNEKDVVVVDGSGSNRSARQVINYIRSLTDNPVTVLINTHGHGDHTVGNSEYVKAFPGIEIVSRQETYDYLTGSGIGYVADIAKSVESRKAAGEEEIQRVVAEGGPGAEAIVANLRQYFEHDIDIRQQAYREAVIAPPTITVESGLTLHRGKRTIEVRYLGPGDTHGDLVVFLPQDHIVATGDMVVHPFPYGFSRDALDWVNTLDSLAALDFDTLIPGHGEVQHAKSYLRKVQTLLRYVQREVNAAIDEGLTEDETAARIDLSSYKNSFAGDDPVTRYYFDEYFAHPNVRRTYRSIVESREASSP
ncbi:MAG: MBL fold metallo-hydrolase [Rhodothermales bacterium]